MKDKQEVVDYIIGIYNNESDSYRRVANNLGKEYNKKQIITEMVRRRYSHLGIPEVIALAKETLRNL